MNRTGKTITTVAAATVAAAAAAAVTLAVLPAGALSGGAAHRGHGAASGAPAAGDTGQAGQGDAFFAGSLNGANEVATPGGDAVGDRDGRAIVFLRVRGATVSFALSFRGVQAPTAAHVHQGAKGANGAVRIPLFAQRPAQGRTTVSGTAEIADGRLLRQLRGDPGGFYVNLHTARFPGGAVRGQLHRVSGSLDMDRVLGRSFLSSVSQGAQVYACTRQQDGTFAFTQHGVRARLDGGISHFFARPGPKGPPAWVAPDRSAVTGKLLGKTANGAANIPELDLAARQAGSAQGLFANSTEILRLNTQGGAAPAGTCDPARQAEAEVPYRADYLFIGGARRP